MTRPTTASITTQISGVVGVRAEESRYTSIASKLFDPACRRDDSELSFLARSLLGAGGLDQRVSPTQEFQQRALPDVLEVLDALHRAWVADRSPGLGGLNTLPEPVSAVPLLRSGLWAVRAERVVQFGRDRNWGHARGGAVHAGYALLPARDQ
jgi:hypothetical protein